jgi:hypothetical protein
MSPELRFCPRCGRPAAGPVPTTPGLEFQLVNYERKINTLSIAWFIYAGFSLVTGIAGLALANVFLSGRFAPWMQGPWAHGPMGPMGFAPAFLHFAWVVLVLRACLAGAAGWGLQERAPWGRIVAIIAGVLSLIRIPFGTAIGIWTLVVLLGYKNSTFYEQL